MPRWVKVAVALVVVVALVLVISKVAGVEHGPGMRGGSEPTAAPVAAPTGAGGHVPPAGYAAPGHVPPTGRGAPAQ